VSPRAVGAAVALAFAFALALVLCVPGRGVDAARLAVDWLLVAVPAVLAAFGRPVTRT
jgi:hypothetical protein